jgi:N6-adenosine-specific RNA methylase IME4
MEAAKAAEAASGEAEASAAEATADAAAAVWPHVVLDAYLDDDDASHRRRPSLFMPLLVPRASRAAATKRPRDEPLVENEPGLCSAMEKVAAAVRPRKQLCAPWRLQHAPHVPPTLPSLAAHVQQQQLFFEFPLCSVDCAACPHVCPPLLFSSLLHNRSDELACVVALGARWLLPRRSAVFLGRARRWHELARLTELSDGYRLLLLDPPWHSRSVQRARTYATADKRELLATLVPAIRALRCRTACLVGVWVTNSRAVQDFVEQTLFAQVGARPLARWYWHKLAADGGYATGTLPDSPHRKPWEVLLLGYVGSAPPPPLPSRLVLVSVPYGQSHHHSSKPALDPLLRAHAAHLLAEPALDASAAWARLPKLEMFAREVRAGWHACGDEVLRFQHEGFWEPAPTVAAAEPVT